MTWTCQKCNGNQKFTEIILAACYDCENKCTPRGYDVFFWEDEDLDKPFRQILEEIEIIASDGESNKYGTSV